MFIIAGILIGMALASGAKLFQVASSNPLVMPAAEGARTWLTISVNLGFLLGLFWLAYAFFAGGLGGGITGFIGIFIGAAISGFLPLGLRLLFTQATIPLIIFAWVIFR